LFRELAYQIESHFTILGRPLNLNCVVITGGMSECTLSFTPLLTLF